MKQTLIVLVLVTAALSSSAQPAQPRDVGGWAETVTVTGTGKASVAPDRVTFTVGVQTVGQTVDAAVNENNARTASTIAALKNAGAKDSEIRTSNFAIWPQQDYAQGKLPRILGYQVSNNVTVTREQVGDAGRLLQVAVNAGVNQSSGIQFEVSNPAKGRTQGMTAAFEDAKAKAALLASAAGRNLGRAITISEGTQFVPPPQPYPRAMRAEAAQVVSDVPIESGTQEMSYNVTVVFELR